MTRAGAAALVAAVCAVSGCGGSGGGDSKKKPPPTDPERAAVTRVLANLQAASRAGDGKRICSEIFTVKLANSITRSSKSGSCAKEVRRNLFSPTTRFTVKRVELTDPADATAVVVEQNGNTSNVFLVKQAGQWRIRGVQAA